jgi:mRNA interferase MazF
LDNEKNRPPRVTPRIKAAPKIRQIYWCEFWKDARLPEIWKTHPVIVVSYKHTLHGHCLVVPTSSLPQDNNEWAHKLSIKIEDSGVQSWAICNQPYTVSTSRLTQFRGEIPLLPKADFNQVLGKLLKWLPQPFPLEK